MSEMVKVKFNDVEYELESGLSVLQASQQIGVKIPFFCWHKHLAVSGNCRMCLVEVKPGPPKPCIACGTTISDGMEVQTETDTIKKARKSVLEFMLINHPLDCPVCDEAYECKLQDYTYEYGQTKSRFIDFHDTKRVYKREDMGKMFIELNRCICCTRCVRYMNERAGEYELERMYRGHNLKITSYKDKLESDFQLNAADLCPVGALEDKKFRFSARAWDLLRVPSICPSCSIGCNIDIDSFKGKIKRFLPRENDAVNACFICDSGRHNFDFVAENRLDKAQMRGGVDLSDSDFDAAIDRARIDLEEIKAVHGAESIALLVSPKMTNEEIFLAKKLSKLLSAGRLGILAGYNKRPIVPVLSDVLPKTLVSDDKTPNSSAARLMKLKEGDQEFTYAHELLAAIEDGKVKALILFHEDLAALNNFDKIGVKKAMALLDFLMVISSTPTEIANQAHVVVPCLTFAEKSGSFTNHQMRVQRLNVAIKPKEGVKSELEIITALGRKFDAEFGYQNYEQAFNALAAEEPAYAGLTYIEIGAFGTLLKK